MPAYDAQTRLLAPGYDALETMLEVAGAHGFGPPEGPKPDCADPSAFCAKFLAEDRGLIVGFSNHRALAYASRFVKEQKESERNIVVGTNYRAELWAEFDWLRPEEEEEATP